MAKRWTNILSWEEVLRRQSFARLHKKSFTVSTDFAKKKTFCDRWKKWYK